MGAAAARQNHTAASQTPAPVAPPPRRTIRHALRVVQRPSAWAARLDSRTPTSGRWCVVPLAAGTGRRLLRRWEHAGPLSSPQLKRVAACSTNLPSPCAPVCSASPIRTCPSASLDRARCISLDHEPQHHPRRSCCSRPTQHATVVVAAPCAVLKSSTSAGCSPHDPLTCPPSIFVNRRFTEMVRRAGLASRPVQHSAVQGSAHKQGQAGEGTGRQVETGSRWDWEGHSRAAESRATHQCWRCCVPGRSPKRMGGQPRGRRPHPPMCVGAGLSGTAGRRAQRRRSGGCRRRVPARLRLAAREGGAHKALQVCVQIEQRHAVDQHPRHVAAGVGGQAGGERRARPGGWAAPAVHP